jgi:hypothetical protein
MNEETLREQVYRLAERFPALGIGSDICSLTLCELEAVYRFLLRMECDG